jgi:hypothetical protein
VTVNLSARAVTSLDEATAVTGETKTDTINRALQVYAYLLRETEKCEGRKGEIVFYMKDPDNEDGTLRTAVL